MRYDIHPKLDNTLGEAESKIAIVEQFKELFVKMLNDESTMTLYPYLSSLSTVTVTLTISLPNTFTKLKRFLPSIKPPLKIVI